MRSLTNRLLKIDPKALLGRLIQTPSDAGIHEINIVTCYYGELLADRGFRICRQKNLNLWNVYN